MRAHPVICGNRSSAIVVRRCRTQHQPSIASLLNQRAVYSTCSSSVLAFPLAYPETGYGFEPPHRVFKIFLIVCLHCPGSAPIYSFNPKFPAGKRKKIVQKFHILLQLLGDFVFQAPYWGFDPGPHWGNSVPRPPGTTPHHVNDPHHCKILGMPMSVLIM